MAREESPQTSFKNCTMLWDVESRQALLTLPTLSVTNSYSFGPSCKSGKCFTSRAFAIAMCLFAGDGLFKPSTCDRITRYGWKHRRGLVCSAVNNTLSRGNHFSECPTFRLGSGGLHHINHTCGFKVTLCTVIYPAYPRTFPPAPGKGKTPSAGRQQMLLHSLSFR